MFYTGLFTIVVFYSFGPIVSSSRTDDISVFDTQISAILFYDSDWETEMSNPHQNQRCRPAT